MTKRTIEIKNVCSLEAAFIKARERAADLAEQDEVWQIVGYATLVFISVSQDLALWCSDRDGDGEFTFVFELRSQ